jgi:hypothetical protein
MAARTRRRTPLKGRGLIALGLLAFLAVSSLVVWRRSVGVSTANAMEKARLEKRSLETERKTLQGNIELAKTRPHIVGEAQRRLGLHVPSDSQTRLVADPGARQ